MESKLQELTKKIYNEGIVKAREDADKILENAKIESNRIVEEAKNEASKILSKAKNESEQLNNKVLSELKMASNQAISLLKQNVTDLLLKTVIKEKIEKSTEDINFIKTLIKELISKWNLDSKSLDLNLILPTKQKDDFTKYFVKEAKNTLDKGIELKFDDRMEKGFKIGPKDNSFVLSFTDEDFLKFFQSFLKLKTKSILFPGE